MQEVMGFYMLGVVQVVYSFPGMDENIGMCPKE
ncbi:hypothetical protein J2W47_006135 [Priestia megaterium]|nr:hypothetical protein [Priestia megaterium]